MENPPPAGAGPVAPGGGTGPERIGHVIDSPVARQSAHSMRSVLDPLEADVRRFRAQSVAQSFLPPIAATVIDPDVTVAQLLNHASGPLPLSTELETHGGTLLLFVSGTGRVGEFEAGYGYPLGVAVSVDGSHGGQATVLAMSGDRHAFANLIVINGLAWGRHTLSLESFKGVMAADETDLFNVTVLEI
ncbi:hypothetical protein BH23GEM9_BH23GEM9_22320 [soil metagenome]